MADPLNVCNAALGEIGQGPIDSFDAQTSLAELCRTHYEGARDAVLEMAPWRCATFYAALVRSGTTPAFRWLYQYLLPTGGGLGAQPYCLTVLETDKGVGTRWELGADATQGRVLFSNESSVGIVYVGRVEALTQWSSLAVQVLVKVLAAKLAKALTGQTSLEQEKMQEAMTLLQAAAQHEMTQTGGAHLQVIAGADQALALANRALSELGFAAIASLAEPTVLAQHLRSQLPAARDAVLELHPWNFAHRLQALTVSTTVPAFKWRYQYFLPTTVLTVLGTDEGNGARFEVGNDLTDGRVLYSDAAAVKIEHIFQQTDYAKWSALALSVLVKLLASQVAAALLSDPSTQALVASVGAGTVARIGPQRWQEALALLPEAKARDGREGSPLVLQANTLLTHRRHRWAGGRR